jgi:hypothetical protein
VQLRAARETANQVVIDPLGGLVVLRAERRVLLPVTLAQ